MISFLDRLFVLMKRHRKLRAPVRVIVCLVFVLQATFALSETFTTATPAQEATITLDVDYSHIPLLTIKANQVSTEELIGSLAKELGFEVKRIGKADPNIRISGRYVGELPDLLPLLLRDESYVATFRESTSTGYRALDFLFLLDSHAMPHNEMPQSPLNHRSVQSDDSAPISISASEIHKILEQSPNMNKDLRQYLETLASRIETGDMMVSFDVDLSDAPRTVSDLLTRINTPIDPAFADNRLENIEPGTPPHYLQGANDAAQHTLDSALARTTSMAIRNLEMLSKSIQGACLEGGCPGITRQEIAEREARMAAEQEEKSLKD